MVGDETKVARSAGLGVSGHVLVQHGLDWDAVSETLLEEQLAAQKARLFGSIEVKFDGVFHLSRSNVRILEQHPEGLQDCHNTRRVVIWNC